MAKTVKISLGLDGKEKFQENGAETFYSLIHLSFQLAKKLVGLGQMEIHSFTHSYRHSLTPIDIY